MLSCIYGEAKTREELYKMKKEKRLIESGESIKKYVQEQYGEWNIKNLQEFWFLISKMNSYNIEKIPKQNQEKIVKRKKIEVKPMDEEEAILQMELLGHEFYLYKDIETGEPAVIYKRKDGDYGIIEAE